MAFNKFMHPRNRYKDNKPNFDELAEKYPEFARHVIRNQAGKATLDFHDSEALRALTCTLLKADFGLDVELPLDRLIPTLSLRLNYVHWVEDLLESTGHIHGTVWGIDIGCGASCIYPLLGAQMNQWNFLASEVDSLAIHYAQENISCNGLADKITVVKTLEDCMFEHLLKSAPNRQPLYHFTMCNPPFFGNALEAQGIMGSRSMSRPEPKSVSTAAELEMIAEGGEVEFVRRMIEESLGLKDQVVWFTSMLGKKSSLAIVKEELRKQKIPNVTHTEFCQGRTMRWGIAWTFKEDLLGPLPSCKKRKLTDKVAPFTFPVPDAYIQRVLEPGLSGGLQNKIQAVAEAVRSMMERLEMSVVTKPTSRWCAKFVLTAQRNTWSHQRRKRRREKRLGLTSAGASSEEVRFPSSVFCPSSTSTVACEGRLSNKVSGSSSTSSEEGDPLQRATSKGPGGKLSNISSANISLDDRAVKKARLDPPLSVEQARLPEDIVAFAPTKSMGVLESGSNLRVPQGNPSDTCASLVSGFGNLEDGGMSSPGCFNKDVQLPAPIQSSDNSADSALPLTHNSLEDTVKAPCHSTFGHLEDIAEASTPSQGSTSRHTSEAKGETSIITISKEQSSSDEADDNYPLDISLDVKLGDRRTIVVVASVADSSKKNLLHQVVQYIKNQMK